MIRRHSLIILLYCIFNSVISIQISAQELPPIEIYNPSDYGADDQNWDIDQGPDASIYIANNKGLLEYNGSNWNLNAIPSQTIIRSVKCVGDKVFTGSYMDFGYWQKDNYGKLNYSSLSKALDIPLKEDEEFWDIVEVNDWIVFQSLDRIYVVNLETNSYETITVETRINDLFVVGDVIYFQQNSKGIYKIENGKAVLAIDDAIVLQNDVVGLYEGEDNALLVLTKEGGFYTFKNDILKPWMIEAQNLLQNVSVYSSIRLENGNFILGTISNGVIEIDSSGATPFRADKTYGLSNNTVLSVFEDKSGNVWLGLDNGINCVNLKSPYKLYRDIQGNLGTVYAAASTEDYLYLGTNQGLFYKSRSENDSFTLVPETMGQVWVLRKINEQLFCGHDKGTFLVNGTKATQISEEKGTWDVKRIPGEESLLIQGNYKGLSVIRQDLNGQWRFLKKLRGYEMSSRYFEFTDEKELLVSHEYKGVFKLQLDDGFSEVTSVKKLPIQKGISSSVFKYIDSVYYAYQDGVYKFEKSTDTFEKDSLLSTYINKDTYVSGKIIPNERKDELWVFNKDQIIYIKPGLVSRAPELNYIPIPYNIRNSKLGYESILLLEDNRFLVGTTQGYLIVDLNGLQQKDYTLKLARVNNYETLQEKSSVQLMDDISFQANRNNLEFSFSIPDFNALYRKSFQYRLKGLNDDWSDWRNDSKLIFENLPYGDYTLEIRGRVGETLTSNMLSYNFRIQKPWYLTPIAIAAYVVIALLLGLMVHLANRRHYKKQKQKLIAEKERELELEQLDNQRQLMEFKNENLQLDIDNKSRELGIATMNLVKKNELLSDIKSALMKSKSMAEVKEVIKTINVNMNDTNDWKLFEEAFNNVDQDFMKRVKELHPSITPNDLRLCAYLRLNLSSKEIAPLLNISHKSVEVKRYRLRKKMGLDHDVSLSNYIIEL
ncbi:triple tyrosine motif-containing protein [uncultured Winogradskyella sp.]|uniref:helix-turn-helix and ligand-binding sensor domain-containing protein n=1 Tax=uncultured Winogradskyella sp. TaxID=395353 RepID=UPI003516E65A